MLSLECFITLFLSVFRIAFITRLGAVVKIAYLDSMEIQRLVIHRHVDPVLV